MPKIIFYCAPGACSLAPHILLQESGMEFKAIFLRANETRVTFPEEFHLINPKMRVPVISIDGTIITEVPAIATAISNLIPDRCIMGQTPLDTARVYEWLSWLSASLHGGGFGHLFRPNRWTNNPADFLGIKVKARENVKDCFDHIEEKLAGVYAVGEALTAVDPYLFVFFRWGQETGFDMKKTYPKYTALVENLVRMDAVKVTLEAEGIKSTL
ncbi:putative glutathione S-transferase GST-6.0 [Xylogone sp. PMI_703]|nr:putative glutathione S-transferase GST-6.0 [Xylogone sp. PMI_703]